MNVFVFVKYLKCVFVKLYMQTVFGFIVTIDIKGLFVVRLTSQGRNRATSEYRNPVKQQKQNTSRTHDKELRFSGN